jgi:predicted ATPase
MIYVEKIKIVNKTYPGNVIRKNFTFECEDVNLIVGNQGCGKSTFLKMMQQNHKDLELTLSDFTIQHGVSTNYFDSEKDNPRIKDPQLYTNAAGINVGIGYGNALMSRFSSHGEILVKYTVEGLKQAKNCIMILDEPESGLSITNQYRLVDSIKEAVQNNCQLFIATHCYLLIKEFNVISLEHHKKMSGEKFLEKIEKSIK